MPITMPNRIMNAPKMRFNLKWKSAVIRLRNRLITTATADHQTQVPQKIPNTSWMLSSTDSVPPIRNMENTTMKDKTVAGLVIAITKADRKQDMVPSPYSRKPSNQ